MSKQSLLLVDGDTRSLRVLEVSLRKAGFSVTPAETVKDALDKLELHSPDLIISETKFATEPDGFELRRRIRGHGDWAQIPFVFLTADTAIESKIRGLELGVDEYLTKPIYIKEIVTRINILLQKRQRQFFDDRKDGTRFAGRVSDMPVVDVIQTIEVSRKSGVIQFSGGPHGQAAIYFRDGKVIDAEAGTLQGEDAIYRLLTWNEGEFEVEFRTVRRREAITASSQGLLMEGMRRLDEWTRLLEQLPPLTHRFEIDVAELSVRLGDVPDDNNRILRLLDGKRTLNEVIDASDVGDLECLQAISRLYFEGMLIDLDPEKKAKRDTGKPMPLVIVEDAQPTPIEEVVSGPIDLARLTARAQAEDASAAVPRRPSAEEIESASIVSEEPADAPGPLLGGYRQSSLRLIDEAVAAAQAIDPSFLEDTPPANPAIATPAPVARVKVVSRPADPRVQTARDLVEKVPKTNGDDEAPLPRRTREPSKPPPLPASVRSSSKSKATSGEIELSTADMLDDNAVPSAIDADESPDTLSDEPPTDPSRRRFAATVRREDSALRMIGSHGRDRAEASGELVPARRAESPMPEHERELVTILPRRITREVPIVEAGKADTAPAAAAAAAAAPAPAVEPPPPAPPAPPPRLPQGHGVVAPDEGPTTITKVLLVLASMLIGATVYTYCHHKSPSQAQVAVTTPADAAVGVYSWDAPPAMGFGLDAAAEPARPDARTAVATVRDAGVPPVRPDAAVQVARADAGVVVPMPASGVDAGVDRVKEARELADKAHDALEEGDADKALELLDASLKLRKTARTYIDRARALQRLDRIDDALASLDESLALVKDYAPAWETKGNILWAAKRYDEAKVAYQKYLDLAPGAKDAESVRQRISGP